jgi:hypothetical protein
MQKQTFAAMLAMGVLAASNIAIVHAQQSGSAKSGSSHTGVISATPIYSKSMLELRRAAQRLRETIQTLAQQPPGHRREQAMSDARHALYDTQQAMIRLPPELRVSGVVTSTSRVTRDRPAQNQGFEDAMKELKLAADRLRESVQAMADQPAGPRRDEAIRKANEALLETQEAMAWVPGYPSTASSRTHDSIATSGTALSGGQGNVSGQPGFGSIAGGGIVAGSDASPVPAKVPAVAGGVGLNARAMLSSEARPEHNVKLVFALNTGNYLADVGVKVKDAKGQMVIDGLSDGPWLYAKLPPGDYTATATYNGQSATKQFSAGSSGQRVAYFRWPASVEQHVSAAGVSPILGTGAQ